MVAVSVDLPPVELGHREMLGDDRDAPLRQAAISPDGKHAVLVYGREGARTTAQVLGIDDRGSRWLASHDDASLAIFSADGTAAAIVLADGSYRRITAEGTVEHSRKLRDGRAPATAVSFDASGALLGIGYADGTLLFVDLTRSDAPAMKGKLGRGKASAVTSIAFEPPEEESSAIARVGYVDGKVNRFDIHPRTSEVVWKYEQDFSRIFTSGTVYVTPYGNAASQPQVSAPGRSASILHRNKRRLSLSQHGAVEGYISLPPNERDLVALQFSADGSRLFTVDEAGTMRTWLVSVDVLLREACAQAGRNLTREEWNDFVMRPPTLQQPYRKTCDEYPEGP
jgi:WD40 repeat protein